MIYNKLKKMLQGVIYIFPTINGIFLECISVLYGVEGEERIKVKDIIRDNGDGVAYSS